MMVRTEKMRIALCCFGVPRSLQFTAGSIIRNIIAPFQSLGRVKLYAHFFELPHIDNPRSGEHGTLDPEGYTALPWDAVALDPADSPEVLAIFEAVRPYGVGWNNDEKTLKNLCHQLISLRKVTLRALEDAPDIVIFARPDLYYHDSFETLLSEVVTAPQGTVFTPFWQQHGGMNDRFCVAIGSDVAALFGMRVDTALAYCESKHVRLGAEGYLGHVMQDVPRVLIPHRATRVRFDGQCRTETFDHPAIEARIRALKAKISQPGLRKIAISGLRLWQAVTMEARYRGLQMDFSRAQLSTLGNPNYG